jgi:predicted negative regulator of RcsB-dependent stress response
MSTYDLEEQEQLAELKAFWKQYGGMIVLAVAAALLVFAGYRTWHWYQASQTAQASAVYGELQKAASASDAKKVRDLAGTLIEQYPRSVYAPLGAFISAKIHFGAGDLKTARAQLAWAAEQARDPGVQALARLRLASVLIDEKAYDEALKVLAAKPEPAFEALFEDLRGDVHFARGAPAEAKAAYSAALARLKPGDDAARELIQLKLDGLGGDR